MKTPVRSHVLSVLSDLQDRLKKLFRKATSRKSQDDLPSYSSFLPLTNVYERSDKLGLRGRSAGPRRQGSGCTLDGNILFVRGERKLSRHGGKGSCLWKENFHGAFASSFALPKGVDPDSINANCRNGLLRIEIEECSGALPKRIPVSSISHSAFSLTA